MTQPLLELKVNWIEDAIYIEFVSVECCTTQGHYVTNGTRSYVNVNIKYTPIIYFKCQIP